VCSDWNCEKRSENRSVMRRAFVLSRSIGFWLSALLMVGSLIGIVALLLFLLRLSFHPNKACLLTVLSRPIAGVSLSSSLLMDVTITSTCNDDCTGRCVYDGDAHTTLCTLFLRCACAAVVVVLGTAQHCLMDWPHNNVDPDAAHKPTTSSGIMPVTSNVTSEVTYEPLVAVSKTVCEDGKGSRTHLLFVYGTLKRNFHWNSKYLHTRSSRSDNRSDQAGSDPVCSGCSGNMNSDTGGLGSFHARFLTEAVTCDRHRLVVGACGVPYLSLGTDTSHNLDGKGDGEGSCVVGELWVVSDECLKNLDDYEGLSKSYYERTVIEVSPISSKILNESEAVTSEGGKGKVDDDSGAVTSAANTVVLAEVYHLPVLPSGLEKGPFLEKYSLSMHRELYNPIQHIQVKQLKYIKTPSTWGKTATTTTITTTAVESAAASVKSSVSSGVVSSSAASAPVTNGSSSSVGISKGMQNTAH
jgi:gamma-glutamylcyclotransferase (GGCT)/AIG2-like uncharacterized protein YtfP